MRLNRPKGKILLLAVLILGTAAAAVSCRSASVAVPEEDPLKPLVRDAGQPTEKALAILSEDFVIGIERPEIRGEDDREPADTAAPTAPAETDAPSEDDRQPVSTDDVPLLADPADEFGEMDSFEGSGGTETDEPVDFVPETEAETEASDDKTDARFDENWIEQGEEGSYTLYDVPLPAFKQIYVIEKAKEYGIPAELIFGVMYTETRYTETAISSNGKYIGIMQIAKSNLASLTKKLGVTELQDFNQNVTAGAYFLSYFYRKYDGDINKVLMCYHCGEGGAHVRWNNGLVEDSYCRKVRKEITRILEAGPQPYESVTPVA